MSDSISTSADHRATALLTIAIPTYNGVKTLPRALDSVLSQYVSEVEVLISDNCSPDDTPSVLANYSLRYPFIRIVRNERNIGPDGNFLQCLQLAKGRFVLLLSDDDLLIENTLARILAFLERHSDSSLVGLNTVAFRDNYTGLENCRILNTHFEDDVCTQDRVRFMRSAGRNWGFLSSFIVSTRRFRDIQNPERFFNTNWLQSYIHILCSNRPDDFLGLIGTPCIAAGIYGNVGDLDVAQVDGINYRIMLDFAISEGGYDRRQLRRLYVKRIGLLGRHTIIKERASGRRRMNLALLFKATRGYPSLWFTLYPVLCIPSCICRSAMKRYNRKKGYSEHITVNRPEG